MIYFSKHLKVSNIVLLSRVLYSRDNVGGSQGASTEIRACHGTTNGDVS